MYVVVLYLCTVLCIYCVTIVLCRYVNYFLSLFCVIISCLCLYFQFLFMHTQHPVWRLAGMPLSFVHILVSHVVSLSSRVLYSVIGLLNFYRCKHSRVLLCVTSIEHLLCQQVMGPVLAL